MCPVNLFLIESLKYLGASTELILKRMIVVVKDYHMFLASETLQQRMNDSQSDYGG